VCLALAIALLALAVSAGAAPAKKTGFRTAQGAMLDPGNMPGVQVTPLITVGENLSGGYRFESIPDGISLRRHDNNRVEVYVNHETGHVPFPYNTAAPTAANGENDFENAQVSRLVLDDSGFVLDGEIAIPSRLGFQRFCSNYLATSKEGFSRPILFTNEESPDYVFRRETSWPPPMGDPAEREAGVVVAHDVRTGKTRPIYGMGRHNHENSIPIPGYGHPVVLSGDDTFTGGPLTGVASTPNVPSQSQLYSYIASSTKSVMRDRGDMWAFV